MNERELRLGDTVLYALPTHHPRAGELRPAIVTQRWSHTLANLEVILDGMNDGAETMPVGSASLGNGFELHAAGMGTPGCWYFRD